MLAKTKHAQASMYKQKQGTRLLEKDLYCNLFMQCAMLVEALAPSGLPTDCRCRPLILQGIALSLQPSGLATSPWRLCVIQQHCKLNQDIAYLCSV